MQNLKKIAENEIKNKNAKPNDILKLVYENEFGGEKITNPIESLEKLRKEIESIEEERFEDLFFEIGNSYARINLKRAKAEKIPSDFINRLVVLSSNRKGSEESFKEKVKALNLETDGICPENFSKDYSNFKNYRIINKKFLKLWKNLLEIKDKKKYIIGIDGRCAAGKSLLAEELSYLFKGQVISMDDFFLPKELRTEERFEEPGGNVHYERFIEEVKNPIKSLKNPNYGVFSCKSMQIEYNKLILNKGIIIVEGSYSLREDLRDLYDFKIFVDVDVKEQFERISKRKKGNLNDFVERWIPLEEKYFKECKIEEICDFYLNTTEIGL